MKTSKNNRTDYQEFLYSLFQKYEIEPDESWSNEVWKVIVNNRSTNKQNLANFYKELSDYNIKNPSDENWTHKIDEKLEKDEQEVKAEKVKEEEFIKCPFCSEDVKKNALKCEHCGDEFYDETEEVKLEEEPIADTKKEEEFKECPYCAEDIKIEAIFCKHCKSSLNEEKEKEKKNSKKKKKSEKVTKNYLWFLVIIGLLGGYWISVGTPDISLIINKSNRESSCLRVVKRERDRTVFLFNDSSIYMDDSWFAKGKLVVSLRQRSNNNKGYNSVLCIAHKNRSVTILPASQESNWR